MAWNTANDLYVLFRIVRHYKLSLGKEKSKVKTCAIFSVFGTAAVVSLSETNSCPIDDVPSIAGRIVHVCTYVR